MSKQKLLELYFNEEAEDGEVVYYVKPDYEVLFDGEVVDCYEPDEDALYCNQDRESSWSWNKQVDDDLKQFSVYRLVGVDHLKQCGE